jgi:hypothetical protein
VTATTETGDLPVVSTAPSAPAAAEVAPGVTATVPRPASPPEPDPAPLPVTAAPAAQPAADGPALVDPGPRPIARLLAWRGRGLTAPGGIALAALLLAPGVLVDWSTDGSFGLASAVAFVVASLAAASAVRVRALATAAALPPLLFATAVAFLAWASGNNRGRRELVLDVGTTMAVSAPVLFLGTALALAVVLGRLVARLVRR